MSWTDRHVVTPELMAALEAARAKWEALRRSTRRADRQAAEAGVITAYASAGLQAPRYIVWSQSPIEAACYRREAAAQAGACVRPQIVEQTTQAVVRAVEHVTSRAFRSRVWSLTRFDAPSGLGRAIGEAVADGVRAAAPRASSGTWRRLLDRWRGRPDLRHREWAFSESAFSCHDAATLGLYECLHDTGGLARETAAMKGLWQVAEAAGWMVPHANVCWLSERPDVLEIDAQGRLYGATGPALHFADGWSHYAWKGVRVPAWMIEGRRAITVAQINRERDPVLRRCMIDIMTPAKFVETSDAVCVSRDDAGALWLKTWHHWDSWAAVEVVNGTPEPDGSLKHYFLQVPPTMRSAREAVAWTYGMSEQDYARLRLRT